MSIYHRARSDSLVKSIVYKVYLRILQVPGISVNSHVAVIFLVFLIGKVENAYICNVKSDWLQIRIMVYALNNYGIYLN